MTVPGLPPQGSLNWQPWAASIHDLVVTSPGGRLTLEAYDDFTIRPDGSIAGAPLAIAGQSQTWNVTGANLPVVASGRLVSAGVGYAYIQLPAAGRLLACGVEFTPGSTNPMAMSWVTGPVWDLTNLTGHMSFGPIGFAVTIKRGATFYPLFSGNWRRPLDTSSGKIHTCAIGIVGDSFIVQVNGETYTGPPDPRTKTLAGSYVFWEPLTTAGPQQGKVAWVAAWSEATSGAPLATNLFVSNADLTSGRQGQVVGNQYQMQEASLGLTPAAGQPGISFGATSIYTELTADMAAGTTTMLTKAQIPPGSTITIDEAGTNPEAATTTGYPSGTTTPYTHTLTAPTTLAHTTGDVVVAAVPANLRAEMYYNQSSQFWVMPNLPVVVFPGEKVYLGNDLTQFVQRAAPGVISSEGLGAGKGAFRAGSWTTATRPTAAAAGAGAQGYDTTLGIPIWSDGTVWRNAAGTIV